MRTVRDSKPWNSNILGGILDISVVCSKKKSSKNVKNLPLTIIISFDMFKERGYIMGVLWIVFHSIKRNPKRALTLSLGMIISLSLLVSVFLTADYMGQMVLAKILKDVNFDFYINIKHSELFEYVNVVKELKELEGIETVDPCISRYASKLNITRNGKIIWPILQGTAGYEEYFRYTLKFFGFAQNMSIEGVSTIQGRLNLTGNKIAVTEDLAKTLKLKPGDGISLINVDQDIQLNATICAIIRFGGRLKKLITSFYGPPHWIREGSETYYVKEYIIVAPIEFTWKLFSVKFVNYFVFVDRDKTLNPWDINGSIKNLRRLEIEIENVCQRYEEYYIFNNLIHALEFYRTEIEILKYGFGISLLPVILLSCYFTSSIGQISLIVRRREIGLLKVKGFSSRQTFIMIILESVLVGLISGIIGAIIGYLSSIQIAKSILWENIAPAPKEVLNKLIFFYLGLSIMLGGVFTPVATIIPARRISKMRIGELLQEYLEKTEMEKWRPRLTLLLFILGVIKTVEMILGVSVAKILSSLNISATNIFLALLIVVLITADMVLVLLGPFFLIYGLSKMVSHYASKLTTPIKFLIKPLLGELSDIATKNFTRRASRTMKIIFLMSLILTLGIALIVFSSSFIQTSVEIEKIEMGSDIKATLVPSVNKTWLVDNISAIKGVNEVSIYGELTLPVKLADKYVKVLIIDENYFNVITIKEEYLEGASVKDIHQKFKNGENCCLISYYLSKEFELRFEDSIELNVITGALKALTLELTVMAVAKVLPGITYIDEPYYDEIVIVSYNYVKKFINLINIEFLRILIDVEDNANSTEIVQILNEKYLEIRHATSIDQEVQQILHESIGIASPKFCYIEFIFILLIAIFGLSLIVVVTTLERQREFGLLKVRGVSNKQILKMMLAESMLIIAVSFPLGILEGIAVAYGFLRTFVLLGTEVPFKIPLVIPVQLYILLSVGSVVFLLSFLVSSYYLTQKGVLETLKIRH